MFIRDGQKMRYISSGYSPKVYDGDFLELRRDIFEAQFSVSTIVVSLVLTLADSVQGRRSYWRPAFQQRAEVVQERQVLYGLQAQAGRPAHCGAGEVQHATLPRARKDRAPLQLDRPQLSVLGETMARE